MECDNDSETGDNFLFVLDLKVSLEFISHACIYLDGVKIRQEEGIFIVEFQEFDGRLDFGKNRF